MRQIPVIKVHLEVIKIGTWLSFIPFEAHQVGGQDGAAEEQDEAQHCAAQAQWPAPALWVQANNQCQLYALFNMIRERIEKISMPSELLCSVIESGMRDR